MKRKLIESYQEDLVVCDNSSCNYKVKNPTGDINADISHFVNKPCPECGENMLTEKDYLISLKVLRIINWLNKWFSWVMFFVPKKTSMRDYTLKIHNGVNLKEKK